MSDYKRPSDQTSVSGDTNEARRGVEQLNAFLRGEAQPDTHDGTEQALPYGEIFQQNYDQIAGAERDNQRTIEQGQITEVPVAALPDPEGVEGPQEFNHHITYEDAKLHTEQLNEVVLPWVHAGAVGNDFKALDQALGRTNTHGLNQNGYYETYRLFYGNAPIVVGRTTKGDLDITGGRHRIYMAKALGLEQLPVHIAGKK